MEVVINWVALTFAIALPVLLIYLLKSDLDLAFKPGWHIRTLLAGNLVWFIPALLASSLNSLNAPLWGIEIGSELHKIVVFQGFIDFGGMSLILLMLYGALTIFGKDIYGLVKRY